jgi:hypothetical protein
MGGFNRFREAVMDAMLPIMRATMESTKERKLLEDKLHNHLFGIEDSTSPNKPTPVQQYCGMNLHHVSEISRSMATLRDIEFYIGRFPYQTTKVSKDGHLQFLAEAFLHEVYILQVRTIDYLKFIERRHRRDPRFVNIQLVCNKGKDFVRAALQNVINVRSSHVHQLRFSDKRIERLGSLNLMCSGDFEMAGFFAQLYRTEYLKARGYWKKVVADSNVNLEKVIDHCFDKIFPIIFDKHGVMLYPENLRGERANKN